MRNKSCEILCLKSETKRIVGNSKIVLYSILLLYLDTNQLVNVLNESLFIRNT